MATSKIIPIPKREKISALPTAEFSVNVVEYEGERRVRMFHKVLNVFGMPSVVSATTLTGEEARGLAAELLKAAEG